MSAPKFTPGPWEIVITRVGPDEIRAGDGSGDLICELPYGASAEPDASTANLIAAAPELYAAAERAMFALGRLGANVTGGPGRAEWEMLRAALSKVVQS